ncbi:MAG: histidine kinase dimerization/phospho-acceptor domain-containing protein, partial [bacterium]
MSDKGEQVYIDDHLNYLRSISELIENNVEYFLSEKSIRTADWSSDGMIRSETEAIIESTDAKRAYALGAYIRENKQVLDKSVVLTDVFSLDGEVIISSADERVGFREPDDDELEEEYRFSEVRMAEYAKVFENKIIREEGPGYPISSMANFSVPIISMKSGKAIGVLVNHISGEYLDIILSAGTKSILSNFDSIFNTEPSLKIYLINQDKLVVAQTGGFGSAPSEEIINTDPVRKCLEESEGFVGEYQNNLGETVLGSSRCVLNRSLVLVSEINKNEALADLRALMLYFYALTGMIALFSIILSIFFSRRLTGRIGRNLSVIEDIGGGNFGARVRIVGHDVISKVGEGINQTAKDLQALVSQYKGSEEKYRCLSESSPDCIKVLDRDGKLLHLSKGGLLEHGFKTVEETKNWNYLATIEDEFVPKVKEALARALMGKTTSFDIRHKQVEGLVGRANREWCNMTFSPIINGGGEPVKILVVSRDISEQKKMSEREADLLALKSKFIDIISHQMRTPLSVIRWNLEAILEQKIGKLTKGQEDILRILYDSSIKIISRIGDLSTATDIE